LHDFILVCPLTLYGISFIFFKNAGGRSILSIAFLKKTCKKMKKTCKKIVLSSAQIAAELQKIKNANWK